MRANKMNVQSAPNGGGEPPPSSGAEHDRVAATIGNWKRKLLDVSKRNRALSFRPNKVTTVTIVNEQPAEVFRQLYLRERPQYVRASPQKFHRSVSRPKNTAPPCC